MHPTRTQQQTYHCAGVRRGDRGTKIVNKTIVETGVDIWPHSWNILVRLSGLHETTSSMNHGDILDPFRTLQDRLPSQSLENACGSLIRQMFIWLFICRLHLRRYVVDTFKKPLSHTHTKALPVATLVLQVGLWKRHGGKCARDVPQLPQHFMCPI